MIKSAASTASPRGGCASGRLDHVFFVIFGLASDRSKKYKKITNILTMTTKCKRAAITSLSCCSLEIAASASHACCCALRTIHTRNPIYPQSASTSKSAPSTWTERRSSCRFGTPQDRSASAPSPAATTGERTESSSFTTSRTWPLLRMSSSG